MKKEEKKKGRSLNGNQIIFGDGTLVVVNDKRHPPVLLAVYSGKKHR